MRNSQIRKPLDRLKKKGLQGAGLVAAIVLGASLLAGFTASSATAAEGDTSSLVQTSSAATTSDEDDDVEDDTPEVWSAGASTTVTPTPEQVAANQKAAIAKFRANLVSKKKTSEVAKLDAMTQAQKNTLANYLLGKSVKINQIPKGAKKVSATAYTYNGFKWDRPAATKTAAGVVSASSASSASVWATQWFSFLGIKLIEIRNTMDYRVSFSPTRGSYISEIMAQSCTVTLDYDIFAEVSTTPNNKFTLDDWTAESDCFVSVKRGAPTPWGQITWSTYEAIHYLKGDNTGTPVGTGWK